MKKKNLTPWIISFSVFGLVFLIWTVFGKRGIEKIEDMIETNTLFQSNANTSQMAGHARIVAQQQFFVEAAYTVKPAVVTISASQGTGFFAVDPTSQRNGSGTIINPQGFLVTSYNLVKDANEIAVTRYDTGHTHVYDGRIVGKFPAINLAIIKINTLKPLPSSMLGNSDVVHPGDWCLAIGSPLGMKQITTSGMIDNVNPTRGRLGFTAKCSQSFAGGPLVNTRGEVIGIIMDKGNAISINQVRQVLYSLEIPLLPNLIR